MNKRSQPDFLRLSFCGALGSTLPALRNSRPMASVLRMSCQPDLVCLSCPCVGLGSAVQALRIFRPLASDPRNDTLSWKVTSSTTLLKGWTVQELSYDSLLGFASTFCAAAVVVVLLISVDAVPAAVAAAAVAGDAPRRLIFLLLQLPVALTCNLPEFASSAGCRNSIEFDM